MKLTKISQIEGQIELISGLHIGSGNSEMHIGGTDNPVIKNPTNNEPYIPGSSLKGKMRSLMEWSAGVVGETDGKPLGFKHLDKLDSNQRNQGEIILRLFGGAPEGVGLDEKIVEQIGPTRLSFWDCNLEDSWTKEMKDKNLLLTEVKMENSIDRIKGIAENPRNTERVPAGARFYFRLSVRIHDEEDLMPEILRGLRLIELTGIGGSGSRGYGKLKFTNLFYEGKTIMDKLAATEV
ncbi:MAG: type III-A CRISPR-associated RAMP protein Csm3 [Sedimenticola sp.]|nr:MAG: type III-A CRISPR-associated RAMP protein Csm3 [Sedimenticola sp.]